MAIELKPARWKLATPGGFSYPGYNEILTGKVDPAIDSNDKDWNPNVTFLEILNATEGFKGRVLAFGSWDVFPYIINTQRSRVPVNAGFSVAAPAATEETRRLNELSAFAPRLWPTVRVDVLTHGYAMEALKNQHPRVTYIAYGETDDFAHDGSYDRYIDAAHRSDRMLANLWNWLQADTLLPGPHDPDHQHRSWQRQHAGGLGTSLRPRSRGQVKYR